MAHDVPSSIELIGVPTNSSGTRQGVARAPRALRDRGLLERLGEHVEVADRGELALPEPEPRRGPSSLLAEEALVDLIHQVGDTVCAAHDAGRLPLLIGGDCPILLGALAAMQDDAGDAGLLFVDGHEDAWPPAASPTGEAADCELGLALGLFDRDLDDALKQALPRLRPEHVLALGPRDQEELAEADVPSVTDRGVTVLRPPALAAAGLAGTVGTHAGLLPTRWWLHVDLDVLATSELAAVDYQQPGGLTWDQLDEITARALIEDGCAGWSVCIYNPDLDPSRREADRIVDYLSRAAAGVVSDKPLGTDKTRSDRDS